MLPDHINSILLDLRLPPYLVNTISGQSCNPVISAYLAFLLILITNTIIIAGNVCTVTATAKSFMIYQHHIC